MDNNHSGLAVELYFDSASTSVLRDLLSHTGSSLLAMNGEPHISLSVHPSRGLDGLIELVADFARTAEPMSLDLASIGTFPTPEGVVFLAPVVTTELLAMHEQFHRRLDERGIITWDHYRPGRWVPHMTVELDIDRHGVGRAIEEYSRRFPRMRVTTEEIGVVEFRPIREWFRTAMGGTKK